MKIKICGIKSAYEALRVANLGVDYLGVIFAESKRKVNLQTAQEIAQIAHQTGIKCVGVFADMDEDKILSICKNANLDVAQIYGEFSTEIRDNLSFNDIEVWKVYSVSDELPNLDKSLYDMPLFDTKGLGLGGNGTSFEWEILKNLEPFSFVLAGGIGVENVALGASYKPRVLDLNSKVEGEDGVKDINLINQVLQILTN